MSADRDGGAALKVIRRGPGHISRPTDTLLALNLQLA